MKKSHFYIFAIISVLVMTIFIILLFFIYFKNNNKIKIGLILPLTEAGKNSGVELLKRIRLAADEANKWGGSNNKKMKQSFEKSNNKIFFYPTVIGYDISYMIFRLNKNHTMDCNQLKEHFDKGLVYT